jgi:hypothetical protein
MFSNDERKTKEKGRERERQKTIQLNLTASHIQDKRNK